MELRVQEALTVALAVMLVGVTGQVTVKPVVGLTTADSPTEPAKLFTLVREADMIAPVAPGLKFTGVPTDMVRSPTWTIELVE